MTTTTTRQQLVEIVDLAALLPALATSRSGAAAGRAGPSGLAHSPAPVRLDIIQALDTRPRVHGDDAEDRAWHDRMVGDHRQGLLPDLWQWARMIEAEAMESCPRVPDELPETPTVASVATWLLAHLDWALEQQWADELVRDVDWWWRRLRRLAGERDGYAPRCSLCLFPIVEAEGGWWRCLGAGHEWSIDSALKRLAEPVVTLREAAAITGMALGTLKQWSRDGRILPVESGRYLLNDIRRLAADTPRRGRPRPV